MEIIQGLLEDWRLGDGQLGIERLQKYGLHRRIIGMMISAQEFFNSLAGNNSHFIVKIGIGYDIDDLSD